MSRLPSIPRWLLIPSAREWEADPEFYAVIDGLCRKGMLYAAAFGIGLTTAYVAAHVLAVGKTPTLLYVDRDPRTEVALWDKLAIVAFCALILVSTRYALSVRLRRSLAAALVIIVCTAMLLDDVIGGQAELTAAYFALVLLVTVSTIPFTAWQTLGLGLTTVVVLYVGTDRLPAMVGVDGVAPQASQIIFLVMFVVLMTGLSSLLHSYRYDQYRAQQNATASTRTLEERTRALESEQLKNERLISNERRERKRLAAELAVAREVQMRLLPATLPAPAQRLAGCSMPAHEVGGDFYDAVTLGPGRLGLLVADVSGKGTAAAFYMAELKGIFRSAAHLGRSPADLLSHINWALDGTLSPRTFISAMYVEVDDYTGQVVLARAGHCPAILARTDAPAELVRPPGLALGLSTGHRFSATLAEATIELQPGDVLLLYTDGLVEARSPDGVEFGYDRLASAVSGMRDLDAETVCEFVLNAVREFAGATQPPHGESFDDDLTLLVLKWPGPSAVATHL